ncbi:MAG: pitrilysin family protein [Gemmatimonadota bacterium]|jgi:zinc protease
MRAPVVGLRIVAAGILLAAPLAAQQAPPAPLPLEEVEFPAFQERTLSNGAQVIVVPQHEQPFVTVNLVIRGGDASDPAGMEGVASFAAQLLNKGTESRTALEIADAIDFMGASLSANAGPETSNVSLGVLTPDMERGLDLMADVVVNPTFPGDELELLRTQTLTALQVQLSQAGAIANRTFGKVLYGDHPYGNVETPASVEAIDRERVAAFHDTWYRPNRALFVVAGDVEADDVVARLDRAFRDWRPADVPAVDWPAPPRGTERTVTLVHKPGSVQSSIRMGHLLMEGDSEDWLPLEVGNQILGASSAGRLFTFLREEKGWTYGAYSSLSRRRGVGYIQGNMEVRNEVTDSAVQGMLSEFERMRDEPVSAEEMERVQAYLTGRFPRQIETPQQIAGQVAQYRILGLDIEKLENYRGRVAALGREDLEAAFREHVHPDRMSVVVVGDATQVMEPLRKIGPITLLDVEGNVIDETALAVRASDAVYETSSLEPGSWSYQVLFQGNPVGTMERTLERTETGDWQITSTLNAGPQTVTQRTIFSEAFRPVEFQNTIAAGAQEFGGSVTFEGDHATGSMSMPQGATEIDEDLVGGTLAGEMQEVALWISDLSEGAEIEFPVLSVQTGTTVNVTATVVGEEEVTVPAGTFQAWTVEISGSRGTQTVLVRKEAPHVLLKQDLPGQPVSIELAGTGEEGPGGA